MKTNYSNSNKKRLFVKLMKESEVGELSLISANPKAYLVFRILVRYMNDHGAVIISQTALCGILNQSLSTVNRSISFLKKKKFVNVAKTGSSNIYYINSNIINVDGIGKGRYGTFTSAVVLCDSELNISKVSL